MARLFTDSSTSNYATFGLHKIGPLISGASQVSVHALVKITTFNTTSPNDNRIINVRMNGQTSLSVGFNKDSSNCVRLLGRSVSTDSTLVADGTTSNSTGSWISVGGVWDYPNDKMRVYKGGTQETNGTVAFANSTYTDSADSSIQDCVMINSVCPPTVVEHLVSGDLAELTIWNGDIGDVGFYQASKRISGLMIRPELLVLHHNIFGNNSPEIDLVGGLNLTINGTCAKSDHPPIIYPTGGL